ncbi:2,3-diphosphoglycerate-dependent phosphoglycerate mutase [Buchnera aphidicola (Kurisakia onigurumii)]|uniref:2,3-diphosphoglycerate-dependent phosphoglycerate mutase n=1 Tax=Buchnera aphidicola TaxID=9 RepID=UPI0031B6EC6F
MKNYKLILIRHGESEWNKLNQFTGWTDVNITEKGKKEALQASRILKRNGFNYFDIAYTSLLTRAIHSLWIIIKNLDCAWIPVEKTWRLNERHYGSLEGLNKEEIEIKYGSKIVQGWRRSYSSVPPLISDQKRLELGNKVQYCNIPISLIPRSESLELTLIRVIYYWKKNILPQIKKNKKIIIVAHGNSIRALVKYLGNISDNDVIDLNIETGKPIIYEFNNFFQPVKYYNL